MKTKHALLVLGLGFLVDVIAIPFKILHWPYSNDIIIIRTILIVIGGVLLLYKLLTHPKLKDFWNS